MVVGYLSTLGEGVRCARVSTIGFAETLPHGSILPRHPERDHRKEQDQREGPSDEISATDDRKF